MKNVALLQLSHNGEVGKLPAEHRKASIRDKSDDEKFVLYFSPGHSKPIFFKYKSKALCMDRDVLCA